MSNFRMFIDYVVNYLTQGNLVNKSKLGSFNIRAHYEKILTRNYIRRVWVIDKVPHNLVHNLNDYIYNQMNQLCPKSVTFISTHGTKVDINVNSQNFKRMLHSSNSRLSEIRGLFESLTETEKLTGKKIRISKSAKININKEIYDTIKKKSESYSYVFSSVNAGNGFFLTQFHIECLVEDNDELQRYESELGRILNSLGIDFKAIKSETANHLKNYGIAGNNKEIDNGFLSNPHSLSSLTPYKNVGLVGGKGINMGLDIDSGFPFFINFSGSGSAQVCLIDAVSGNGKTFLAFNTLMQLAFSGVHCSAIDIKGGEYSFFKEILDTTEIKMTGTNSRFVNTLRLDDMLDVKEPEEAFDLAVSGTKQLLYLMSTNEPLDSKYGTQVFKMLGKAVYKTLLNAGVRSYDSSTFKNTKNMKLSNVLEVLSVMSESKSFDKDKVLIARDIISNCNAYLGTEGEYSNAFKNEITLGEIINSELVVYNFNKNTQGGMDELDAIKIFMVQFLDTRKQSYRKSLGKFTAAFYEELQRCSNYGNLMQFISESVTGSRSNNAILFLLTNNIEVFEDKNMSSIKRNITTRILGYLEEDSIETYCRSHRCEDIRQMLEDITDTSLGLKNTFVVKYNTGQIIGKDFSKSESSDICRIKVILPPKYTKLFQTRTIDV